MTNILLYLTTVAVWGSSWLAIKYQLGTVAPEVSVAYRFVLAATFMLGYCALSGRRLRFDAGDHLRMAFQGVMLFGTNYYLLYLASQYLTTGLVAVLFSTVVVFSILGNAALFRTAISGRVAFGGLLGVSGITLVFWQDLAAFDLSTRTSLGLLLAIGGTLAAAIGMLSSALYQKRGLPVIETTSIAMAYGAIYMTGIALISGKPFVVDVSPAYLGSLAFLAVFASVIGFSCYLTLLGRIGADRASYATVLFPIIALSLSMVFENFQWTTAALMGTALILLGNLFILGKPKPATD
ncbi:MAG: EamA family transporter [Rhodospirillales bacterium]|nr:EamA family transporter [Rhodospirillales bacterium]